MCDSFLPFNNFYHCVSAFIAQSFGPLVKFDVMLYDVNAVNIVNMDKAFQCQSGFFVFVFYQLRTIYVDYICCCALRQVADRAHGGEQLDEVVVYMRGFTHLFLVHP